MCYIYHWQHALGGFHSTPCSQHYCYCCTAHLVAIIPYSQFTVVLQGQDPSVRIQYLLELDLLGRRGHTSTQVLSYKKFCPPFKVKYNNQKQRWLKLTQDSPFVGACR